MKITNKISLFTLFIKRTLDISFSIIILFVFLIPLILISIFIKFDGGPIIYKHLRVGRNKKTFYCLKFRSMTVDADKKLDDYLNQNPLIRIEFEKTYKLQKDPRITYIGNFLRKTSLDELPQLFNVIRGDMSLVGIRPVTIAEYEKYYGDNANYYYTLRPGITGLWQISGRSNTTYRERIILDKLYFKNFSIMNDFKILFATIPVVIFGKGAY